MAQISDRIMAKIKKCLALAASDNPHEAAAALRQAEALMREHGVSADQVELADVGEASEPSGSKAGSLPRWHAYLISVIQDTYGVWSVARGISGCQKAIVFVGVGGAEAVAAYAYAVLRRQVQGARAAYYKRLRGRRANRIARADHYAEGWVYGVGRMLADRKTAPPELVERYKAERYPDIERKDPISRKVRGKSESDSHYAGYADGRAAQLHDGLGAGADQRKLTHG